MNRIVAKGTSIQQSIIVTGSLRTLQIESAVDGSVIRIGGTTTDQMNLYARGMIGTGTGGEGVDLEFPGLVRSLVARGWHGGCWKVGSVGKVQIKNGDFSPRVDIAGAFNDIQIRRGDFLSPEFKSGTADTNNDGDAMNDGDGDGMRIRVKRGTINSPSIELDGSLGLIQGSSINANINVKGQIKLIRQTDRSEAAFLEGNFTAQRFGRIEGFGGNAQFDLIANATAETLQRKSAVDSIRLVGANWTGGRIETQPNTWVNRIKVKARGHKSIGGEIQGDINLIGGSLVRLNAGDILQDFTIETGDLKRGNIGRILGGRFHIGGDVLGKLTTISKADPDDDGLDDGVLKLLNPLYAFSGLVDPSLPTGILQIDNLTDKRKVRTDFVPPLDFF